MNKYHRFVFDIERRQFVGQFDEMYKAETTELFDSWHQEDTRQLQRKIDLSILEEFCFSRIMDIGCGKGSLTHLLKKKNNEVLALDISKTAIKFARERYPDITFETADVSNLDSLKEIFEKFPAPDLVFSSEVFSYIPNWRNVIEEISKNTEYFLISLFLPENPIGFVKSERELIECIDQHFTIQEHISLHKSRFSIVFAKKKH